MLKPGIFLHIRLFEIESEGTFQECTVFVTHKFRGRSLGFWEGGGGIPPNSPRINTVFIRKCSSHFLQYGHL